MRKFSIGFIGIGVMGRHMAGHLLKAGHKLHIYDVIKEKAENLIEKGAIWHDSVKSVAESAEILITIVGYPADVEEIYFNDGILQTIKKGSWVIDMTTSDPELAIMIYQKAKERNIKALDAPVSGGEIGARDCKLSIMVGGDEDAFKDMFNLFQLMGSNIVYQGEAGSGQHTKICNQIAIAAGMLGVCEAIAYAERSGLNSKRVLESIEKGAAGSWSMSNLAPKIIKGNFEPGFLVKHFVKDLNIASQSAKGMKLDTPALNLARSMYNSLAESGGESMGTQALYKIYSHRKI